MRKIKKVRMQGRMAVWRAYSCKRSGGKSCRHAGQEARSGEGARAGEKRPFAAFAGMGRDRVWVTGKRKWGS